MVSQHRPQSLPRLDLWLAASIGMDSALLRVLARSGVDPREAAEVRRSAAAAGITERCLTTVAQIVGVFGTPAIARSDRLVYDSVLWPAHQFIWAVSRWGDAGPLGFRLREPTPVASIQVDETVDRLRAHFRSWHHTEHEVRCALGAADRVIGHPHSSSWLYVTFSRRVCVEVAFNWGLLRELSARAVPADMIARFARTGPWGRPSRAPFLVPRGTRRR